ncbi:PREDICTED: uncharacterized protein LOC104605027 isoform X2 [Nelumbo nucifera]|uniref:Uncharacterized protein LOC104605027 isoform X2 n=2 Tax=Nelumbo nucifera TaxID=4432 RepID=A0A1U8AXY2_NELNU|nr:PREDICTED: uncharacterized protein LOC104605027 isoform X2 [Nelumbo nucifera]DAD33072.1 TPA_asm: hypothetical protein HUJ06_011923 [Nelumbo nucifera]
MDDMALRDRDHASDLESGGTTSEEGSKEPISGIGQVKRLLNRVWSGSVRGEDGMNACRTSNSGEFSTENQGFVTDKNSGGEESVGLPEKKVAKEKRKKPRSKKPPKPPRPPRGPSLDAADLKLIKELSEIAMLKRARIERMKTLKKMKAAKASSSNSTLSAMLITVLFCIVIILQGMCSIGRSILNFNGSPTTMGLISIRHYKNHSARGANETLPAPNHSDSVANGTLSASKFSVSDAKGILSASKLSASDANGTPAPTLATSDANRTLSASLMYVQ